MKNLNKFEENSIKNRKRLIKLLSLKSSLLILVNCVVPVICVEERAVAIAVLSKKLILEL